MSQTDALMIEETPVLKPSRKPPVLSSQRASSIANVKASAPTPASSLGKTQKLQQEKENQKTKEQLELENQQIQLLTGEECVKLLNSSKFQDREQCMQQLTLWLKESSDLPKGFMIITCQTLPVEKVCKK